jgi:hypothetical protein
MTSALNASIMRLTRRAEANDPASLVATFVDVGSLTSLLTSRDHQVIFGRRGTGKTHALTYLAESLPSTEDMAVLVDMRQLGSSVGMYSDETIPLAERGTRLLLDVLEVIQNNLVDAALEGAYAKQQVGEALPLLDGLADQMSRVRIEGSVEREASIANEQSSEDSTGLALSPRPSIALQDKELTRYATEARTKHSGVERHAVHFGATGRHLSKVIGSLGYNRLWLLFDEWSSLPLELQPLLADFVRRCFMPLSNVTIKLAAIEQRARFKEVKPSGDYLGIELGADASADLDLDDFMVFGNDEERAKAFFAELLFRHISPFPDSTTYLKDAKGFMRSAFTQTNAFTELVRAAEGVPRDAINVAILSAQRADNDLISVPHVRAAAKTWYNRDKEPAATANEEARALLIWIIDEVIGERRAKAFMLQQGPDTQHALIRSLYDQRILHVVRKSVAARDKPGVRFNVYAIDYGCYVDLMTTARAPKGLLPIEDDRGQVSYVDVPAEDYRSIRRAILNIAEFERSRAQGTLY